MKTLQITTAQTWLKISSNQADSLPDIDKISVKMGEVFPITSHEKIETLLGEDGDQHIQVSLVTPLKGRYNWLLYQRHGAILDGDNLIYPCPEVDTTLAPAVVGQAPYQGKKIMLPSGSIVYTDQPIIYESSFCWGEATHDATRIPKTRADENRIIRLAAPLQRARKEFGKPVRVTSWYRPEPFNSRAGGASRSQHLGGGAVDIVVEGMSGKQMAKKVLGWWPGGVGIYPGNRKHILHLDVGARRSWGI